MKKLCVVFPGRKYGCDRSLLYFSSQEILKHGYEMIYLHYNANIEDDIENISMKDFALDAMNYTANRLKDVKIKTYDKIIFLSKSIGTVLASELTNKFADKQINNIYLTPLKETIKNVKLTDLVLCGDKDRFLPNAKEILAKFPYSYIFPYSSHSFEHKKNISQTVKTIEDIVSIVKVYLETIGA